jgi:hypothetical protein
MIINRMTRALGLLDDVRFEALTAMTMNITIYRDVTPCSVVDICKLFRGMKMPPSSG